MAQVLPDRDDVESICVSHRGYLAKADSGEPHPGSPSWFKPFQIDTHSFAYYQPVRNRGKNLWVIALEDEQQGDGLAIAPGIGLPLLSRVRKWLAGSDGQDLDYPLLMNAWQFFEMLAGETVQSEGSWLRSAVYQHLWIGIYAPGTGVSIPHWREDELETVREFMDAGLKMFESVEHKVP